MAKKNKPFKLDRYKFEIDDRTVIAKSTYAGKEVIGVAKCHPNDTFDLQKGQLLAAARCNRTVAKLRAQRAKKKYERTCEERFNACQKAAIYMNESLNNVDVANELVRYVKGLF